jgi:ATP-dependent RNA helicase RhlE
VLASAETGSGKTAAFLLPILHNILGKPRGSTRALVLVPTRELAAQVLADMQDLAVHTPVTGAAVFGGVGPGPQEHAFRSGVDVLVATPGRLLDHLRRPYAKLDRIEHLVLDEADRMLDMGFCRRFARFSMRAGAPPDAVLQRDDAAADSRADQGHAPQPAERAAGAATARRRDHAGRLPGAAGAEVVAAGRVVRRGDINQVLVFHADEASRESRRRLSHARRRACRAHSRQSIPVAAHARRSKRQERPHARARRHRHRGARDRRRRARSRDQLRRAARARITSHRVGRTGRAEPRARRFTFVAPENAASWRRSNARSVASCPSSRCRISTTRPGRRRGLEIPAAQREPPSTARASISVFDELRPAPFEEARGQGLSSGSSQGPSTGSGQGRSGAPGRPPGAGGPPSGRKWSFRPRRRPR